jgi:hypothetical protein
MRTLTLIALAALLLAAPALAQRTQIEFPPGIAVETERLLVRANVQLTKACPDLLRYWGDVVSAKVEIWEAMGYRQEQYGWSRELVYELRIADAPAKIPAAYRAGGHTLHFYFGAGQRPGIVIQKREAQLVCDGKAASDGSDRFIGVPDLAFVDRIRLQ